jgi:hypothetical protein
MAASSPGHRHAPPHPSTLTGGDTRGGGGAGADEVRGGGGGMEERGAGREGFEEGTDGGRAEDG